MVVKTGTSGYSGHVMGRGKEDLIGIILELRVEDLGAGGEDEDGRVWERCGLGMDKRTRKAVIR